MSTGLRHVPFCLAVSGLVGVVAAPIGWFSLGPAGAAGAAAGVAIMTMAYLISAVVIVWVDAIDRKLLLPIALLTYLLKIVMLGAVGFSAKQAGWPGLMPMAVSAAAVIILWPLAHLWWVLHGGADAGKYQAPHTDGGPRQPRSMA